MEEDVLGQWWIANPGTSDEGYEAPSAEHRVPGLLRRVAPYETELEIIGFLGGGERPSADQANDNSGNSRPHIWGIDQSGKCISLLDCRWLTSNRIMPHMVGGDQSWSVGWASAGDAWVTPDDVCSYAVIYVDDLRAFSLYRHIDSTTFSDARDEVTIDLRDEILLSASIDGIQLQLVRHPKPEHTISVIPTDYVISVENVVYWTLSGSCLLSSIRDEWVNGLERFIRFMAMRESVVTGVRCIFDNENDMPNSIELSIPRLPRSAENSRRYRNRTSPMDFMATLHSLVQYGGDPNALASRFWDVFERGDLRLAMSLHLESQDRLIGTGSDSSFLNAVRSIESTYSLEHPASGAERINLRRKLEWAVLAANEVGAKLTEAWPLSDDSLDVVQLRNDAAHGNNSLADDFGLKCLGFSKMLQWIQRCVFLSKLGLDVDSAAALIRNSWRFKDELKTLERWREQL